MNSNFSTAYANALNRTGGTMTGSLTTLAILPTTDNASDIGSAALSYNDAWFDGTVTIATASITSMTVTSISCTGCVTSTNILDGTILNADINASAGIVITKLATFTSAELATQLTNETGTGVAVFNIAPTLTTVTLTETSGAQRPFFTAGEGAAASLVLAADDGDNATDVLELKVVDGGAASLLANNGEVTVWTSDAGGVFTVTDLRATNAILTTPTLGAATATTLDTGQGANELYDMDQNVLTTSSPTFVTVTAALNGNAATATNVVVGGITGLGTGVGAALTANIGTAGAPVLFNGAGGTPSSLVLTNASALPAAAVSAGTFSGAFTFGALTVTTLNTFTFNQSVAIGSSPTFTTVTANLTGNAATATALATARAIGGVNFDGTAAIVPTTIVVADTTDTTSFCGFWTDATGDLLPKTDGGCTYNASTGVVTATGFAGPLTGNVTGNVTGSAGSVAVGGITGLGTGVGTALAVNVGSAGAPVLFNGAGGTPSSITLTNATFPSTVALLADNETVTGAWTFNNNNLAQTASAAAAARFTLAADAGNNASDVAWFDKANGGDLSIVQNNGTASTTYDTSGNWAMPSALAVTGQISAGTYAGADAVFRAPAATAAKVTWSADAGNNAADIFYINKDNSGNTTFVNSGFTAVTLSNADATFAGTVTGQVSGSTFTTDLKVLGAEAGAATLYLWADEGDDAGDKYAWTVNTALNYLDLTNVAASTSTPFRFLGTGSNSNLTITGGEGAAASLILNEDDADDSGDTVSISMGSGSLTFTLGLGSNVMGLTTSGFTLGSTTNFVGGANTTVTIPLLASSSGTRYICSDTSGTLTDSASACSGTDADLIAAIPSLLARIDALEAELFVARRR